MARTPIASTWFTPYEGKIIGIVLSIDLESKHEGMYYTHIGCASGFDIIEDTKFIVKTGAKIPLLEASKIICLGVPTILELELWETFHKNYLRIMRP